MLRWHWGILKPPTALTRRRWSVSPEAGMHIWAGIARYQGWAGWKNPMQCCFEPGRRGLWQTYKVPDSALLARTRPAGC